MGAILGRCGPASLVNWWDFRFQQIEVDAISSGGTPYKRRVSYGMPKIPKGVLESVFYLYRSREDAERGEPFGGTGVFIGMPTEYSGITFIYAVTNWHLAVRDGFSVMRFNKRNGGVDIFELDPQEWEFPPNGPDIAVAMPKVSGLKINIWMHQVFAIQTQLFVPEDEMALSDSRLRRVPRPPSEPPRLDLEIGPGEDVFMVGRFIDHDGKDANIPSVRFGNISTLPQPIEQPSGSTNNKSFILDLHSRTGYSGSPVFVYRTPGSDLTTHHIMAGPAGHFVLFLGLHWGQFPEAWEIKEGKAPDTHAAPVSGNDRYIKGMSGMTLAVPAWDILEFLQMPQFELERKRELEDLRKTGRILHPVAETAEKTAEAAASDENPQHREDFTSLLNAAAKTKPQGDQT